MANRHPIILMQTAQNRSTRTFMDYDSISQAMDGYPGIVSQFPKKHVSRSFAFPLRCGVHLHKDYSPYRQYSVCKTASRVASFAAVARLLIGFPLSLSHGAYNTTLEQHLRCRSPLVRSELLGAGSTDAVYALADSDWGSRLRGVAFYSVTGFVAIFLFVVMLVSHPFVLLFDRYKRKVHHIIGKIWASLTIYPFFNVKFEGLENLPPSDTPAVYVSNHRSYLDIYTVLTLGRTFKFISKTGVFVIPIVGWAMFLMGFIPLRRMDSSSQLECLKRCMDLVRKGASVFFFPEGTRSKDGKLGAFKKGAFSVAAKTGVPVVPITLIGTGNLMPAGRENILNTGSVKVVIHKPIQGSDPEILCNVVRTAIADVLLHHGYGVH